MNKLEPTVILLSVLLVFFTVALFCAEWWFKTDSQFFQTVAGLASGMSGALLLRITGKPDNPHLPSPPTPTPPSPGGQTTLNGEPVEQPPAE